MGHIKLEGAVDLHCHFGPDFLHAGHEPNHSVTALQAAQEAAKERMAAIVLKAHDFPTPALAYSINQVVPEIHTCGGITLDHQVGGINPIAVEHALRLGAKIVWLPTVASHQDFLNGIGPRLGYPGTGFCAIDDEGELTSDAREILELVLEHDAILATGHTTAQEHFKVAKELGKRGRVVVTHACEHAAGPHLTPDQCKDLAELGAYIELTALSCFPYPDNKPIPLETVAKMVQDIGPDQIVLSTDFGWCDDHPHPVDGLRDYLDGLWEAGVSEQDLKQMVCDNGARLLGLKG